MIDFDIPVERRNTSSIKWDRYKGRNVIPMWLADMDFRSPRPVIKALLERVEHGIFGYTSAPEVLYETVIDMLRREYDWKVHPEWLVWLPGLVTGLNLACHAFTAKGDGVMSAFPVYNPFLEAPRLAERRLVKVELKYENSRYELDYDGIEAACDDGVKMFELCNPHNPVGRAFSLTELERLAEICLKHNMVISSDEIHCGLILDEDKRHIPIASIDPEIAERSITMMAPSKTYNIPGLGCAFAVVPNREMRTELLRTMKGLVPFVNTLGFTAALAAFRDCGEWHAKLITYLRRNRDELEAFVASRPGIFMPHVEATYLGWVDVRELGLEQAVAYFEDFGVGFSDGAGFGMPGFIRINFACPHSQLKSALEMFDAGLANLNH